MTPVRLSLVVLAAALAAPAAASAPAVRMQDFVTVQSQQSSTNYTDHYTLGADGRIRLSKLAPVAASVTPVDQGGVLHVASTAPPGVTPPADAARPATPSVSATRSTGGRG